MAILLRRQFTECFGKIGKAEARKDRLIYFFHDIRYPCVTNNMIHMVAQKAAIYGQAVTAGIVDENIFLVSGNKYMKEKF